MAESIITPRAIASYPHIWEPQEAMDGGDPKYSISLIFDDDADLSKLEKEALEALHDRFGNKARFGAKYRSPFRQDGADKGYPFPRFLSARSTTQPGVVGRFRGANGKPMPLANPDELYAGAIVRCELKAFAYEVSGNRGVSFGLNNIQVLDSTTPRLDGKRRAEDVFEALEDPEEDANPFGDGEAEADLWD